jgi:uncharacterized phage-associated protein
MIAKIKNKNRALDVALYFIKKGLDEKKPITNKKVQKLVYYAQAWSLVLNNEKLFNERIEAWVHGPAIPSLYEKFMQFGSEPIVLEPSELAKNIRFSKKQEGLLNNVWKVYGKYPADYLEALTHSELPWQEARGNTPNSQPSNNTIKLETIKEFYARKLRENSKRGI